MGLPCVKVMKRFGSGCEVTCQQKPPSRKVPSLGLFLLGESAPSGNSTWIPGV